MMEGRIVVSTVNTVVCSVHLLFLANFFVAEICVVLLESFLCALCGYPGRIVSDLWFRRKFRGASRHFQTSQRTIQDPSSRAEPHLLALPQQQYTFGQNPLGLISRRWLFFSFVRSDGNDDDDHSFSLFHSNSSSVFGFSLDSVRPVCE